MKQEFDKSDTKVFFLTRKKTTENTNKGFTFGVFRIRNTKSENLWN